MPHIQAIVVLTSTLTCSQLILAFSAVAIPNDLSREFNLPLLSEPVCIDYPMTSDWIGEKATSMLLTRTPELIGWTTGFT